MSLVFEQTRISVLYLRIPLPNSAIKRRKMSFVDVVSGSTVSNKPTSLSFTSFHFSSDILIELSHINLQNSSSDHLMETNPNPSKETPKRYIACWACHVSVGIPKFEKDWLTQFKVPLSSLFASKFSFQCGWCGAITDLKPTTQRHGLLLSSSRKTDSRWKCLVLSSEILVTGFVVTLLSMITGVGYWVILPQAYNDIGYLFWNRGLTLFFAINIFVNYFMASWKRSNAEKRDLPNTKTSTLPKGIYDNYRSSFFFVLFVILEADIAFLVRT